MEKVCIFPECGRKSITKLGHCNGHRKQFQKGKILKPLRRKPERYDCVFPNCNSKRNYQDGYCSGHHKQLERNKPLTKFRTTIGICTIVNCGRRHWKNGLCQPHNTRKNKGLPLGEIKPLSKRGTGCVTSTGYRVFSTKKNGKNIYFYEHRLIMEQFLGRKLFPKENVHHINGNRLDNRIENLELWSTHQPTGQRVIDKINWAKEILEQYKNDIYLLDNRKPSLDEILLDTVSRKGDSNII